ncbi:hypothetical protein [Shimia thalassica]|uniref:hypothetical protein n=1 Tax=Shimia thalassica TaxID=1715693 RepID=UPI0026E1A33A|nr:hypothetical protein [Shimia thalassica]MDO6481590.1 hypothetical protein [Shimia thalassica]
MRPISKICLVVLLAACNSPSMHFEGISPHKIMVLGTEFELRRNDDLVQVIRTSREYAPRLSQQLGRRAEIAVEQTYGCPVDRIRGDASMMLAYLKCGEPDDLARIGNGA